MTDWMLNTVEGNPVEAISERLLLRFRDYIEECLDEGTVYQGMVEARMTAEEECFDPEIWKDWSPSHRVLKRLWEWMVDRGYDPWFYLNLDRVHAVSLASPFHYDVDAWDCIYEVGEIEEERESWIEACACQADLEWWEVEKYVEAGFSDYIEPEDDFIYLNCNYSYLILDVAGARKDLVEAIREIIREEKGQ